MSRLFARRLGVDPMTTVAPSITGALRLDGFYLGVDPAIPGVVYSNRTSAGGWETAVISEHDNKIDCDVYYGDADVRLCVTPDGDFETRPGSAAPGASLPMAMPDSCAMARAGDPISTKAARKRISFIEEPVPSRSGNTRPRRA